MATEARGPKVGLISASTQAIRRLCPELIIVVLVPITVGVTFKLLGYRPAGLVEHLRGWVLSKAYSDSWGPMQAALDFVSTQGNGVYRHLFFHQHIKFQYPPTSLLVNEALLWFGMDPSASLLNRINWHIVWLNAAALGLLSWSLARYRAPRSTAALASIIGASAGVLSYPILKAFTLGQIQLWIDFLFTLACLCWVYDRKRCCGAAVGLICVIKPQFSLFLLWGLFRRETQFSVAAAATIGLALSISIPVFGWQNHLDYIDVLKALSVTGETYFPNQSMNGILNRLMENGSSAQFQEHGFPPFHPLVYAGTLISSLLLVGFTLLCRFLKGRICWISNWRRLGSRWRRPLPGSTTTASFHPFSFRHTSPFGS